MASILRNAAHSAKTLRAGYDFDGFVAEDLDLLLISFASCDGDIFPITAVWVGDTVRYFKAEDEESLGEYVDRVARFSHIQGGRRVSFCRRAQTDLGVSAFAGLYWIAGHRQSNGEVKYRHGFFDLNDQVLEGSPSGG